MTRSGRDPHGRYAPSGWQCKDWCATAVL